MPPHFPIPKFHIPDTDQWTGKRGWCYVCPQTVVCATKDVAAALRGSEMVEGAAEDCRRGGKQRTKGVISVE